MKNLQIEENIKQRIGWLKKRIGMTPREAELITFQMKELADQLSSPELIELKQVVKRCKNCLQNMDEASIPETELCSGCFTMNA